MKPRPLQTPSGALLHPCHTEQHLYQSSSHNGVANSLVIILCLSSAFIAKMKAKPKACYTQAQSYNLHLGSKHFTKEGVSFDGLVIVSCLHTASVAEMQAKTKVCYTQAGQTQSLLNPATLFYNLQVGSMHFSCRTLRVILMT